MITEFHDKLRPEAHRQFQVWRRDHRGGYFLNAKTRTKFLLHSADCDHHHGDTYWQPEEVGQSLTAKLKVCSDDRQELRTWALEHAATVSDCNHCI
jgi:purine nucleoside permease